MGHEDCDCVIDFRAVARFRGARAPEPAALSEFLAVEGCLVRTRPPEVFFVALFLAAALVPAVALFLALAVFPAVALFAADLFVPAAALDCEVVLLPDVLPPFADAVRFTALPRPDPLFFPPPVSLFTVAHARAAASSSGTPRAS